MAHATFSRCTGTIAAVRGPIFARDVAEIERERVVDFGEHRHGARRDDRADGRDERERGNDDLVAAADAERRQRAREVPAVPLDSRERVAATERVARPPTSNAATRAGVRDEWYRNSDRSRSTAVTASISSSPMRSMPFPSGSRRVTAGVPPSIASRSV